MSSTPAASWRQRDGGERRGGSTGSCCKLLGKGGGQPAAACCCTNWRPRQGRCARGCARTCSPSLRSSHSGQSRPQDGHLPGPNPSVLAAACRPIATTHGSDLCEPGRAPRLSASTPPGDDHPRGVQRCRRQAGVRPDLLLLIEVRPVQREDVLLGRPGVLVKVELLGRLLVLRREVVPLRPLLRRRRRRARSLAPPPHTAPGRAAAAARSRCGKRARVRCVPPP